MALRRLSRLLWLVPGLAAVAALGVAVYVGSGALRARIESELGAALHAPVTIRSLEVGLWPRPGLEARGIRVGQEEDPVSAAVGLFDLALEPGPLRRGFLVIRDIEIEDAALRILRDGAPDPGKLAHSLDALSGPDEAPGSRVRDRLDFFARRLQARDLRIEVLRSDTGERLEARVERLLVAAHRRGDPLDVEVRGEILGQPFDLAGVGGPLPELLAPADPYPFRLGGRVGDVEVEARGTLRAPLSMEGVSFDVQGRAPGLRIAGVALPDVGPIALSGVLANLDGSLGFDRLTLRTLEPGGPSGRVEGRVGKLDGLEDFDLAVEASLPSLALLQPWSEVPLPEDVGARVDLTLSDSEGPLRAEGRAVAERAEAGVRVAAEGEIADLRSRRGIDLAVTGEAPHLASLSRLAARTRPLPPIGPVRLRARVVDRDGRLAAEDIRLDVASPGGPPPWARVAGSVQDLVARAGILLEGRMAVRSAERFGEFVGYPLPPVGSFEASAQLSDHDGSLGLESLRITTPRGGLIDLDLDASLDDLRERNEIAADVALRGRDLSVLGALLGQSWPAIGPFSFQGRLAGSDESLVAEDAHLAVGETRLAGDLDARFAPGMRPRVHARLRSSRGRLVDLLEPAAEAEPWSRERLAETLPLDRLGAADVDLDFQVEVWEGRIGTLRDVRARLALVDGRLDLREVGARYRGGAVELTGALDLRSPLPELSLRLEGTGVDLRALLSQLDGEAEATGVADLFVDLRTRGRSPQQWLLDLNGEARFALHDGSAISTYSRRFVVNLATAAFPFLKLRRGPRVGCAFAELSVEDGIARVEQLFLEEGEIAIAGSGRIDLPALELDLRFEPHARDRAPLSVAPRVLVRGPLEAPEFTAVKRTVFSSLATGVVGAAGRLGMRLVDPFGRRGDPAAIAAEACERIRGRMAREPGDGGT